ncbi:MAG: N-6 DNA methylase [Candidatus Jacksonbacteria bacterium]
MLKEIKQKKQDLGIFYTDQRIADFVFDILKIWKDKEEKESSRWESRKHFPSVIDPAVGEGVFLKAAVESGFTKTDYIFGLDIDEEVVKKWRQINLLKEFGGKEDDLEAHFFRQNGLDRIHWEQHTKKYRYKLKQKDIKAQQFDAVVGNPPYGGLGIYEEMKMLSETVLSAKKVQRIHSQKRHTLFGEEVEKIFKNTTTEHVKLSLPQLKIYELKELSKNLLDLEIWKDNKYLLQRISYNLNINGIEINIEDILTLKEIEKLKSFPIEILFLERFIQLAKSGGWIAIIIPDGILTNSNSHYVREFISKKARVEAVVSLPRDAFKNVGTSAKTSILFLQKYYKDQGQKQDNYPVFLASVDSLDEKNFNLVKDSYKNYYNKTMSNKNLVQITTDEKDRELVMVRIDKTLNEIMTTKPNSRWDAGFWLPIYDEVLKEMKKNIKTVDYLSGFIKEIGQGDVPRKNRGEKFVERGVRFIEVEHIKNTGIYFYDTRFVMESQYKRLKRVELTKDSILLVRSGATIGKVAIVTTVYDRAVVNGHINRILCKKINPYYITLFLKTKYGQLQLERLQRGVAQPELNFDEISSIEVAILDNSIQQNIESEYKKMSKYHDKAMEAKKNNQETEYKKNIETAEKMLKDLIVKTEAVIRGERENIL